MLYFVVLQFHLGCGRRQERSGRCTVEVDVQTGPKLEKSELMLESEVEAAIMRNFVGEARLN